MSNGRRSHDAIAQAKWRAAAAADRRTALGRLNACLVAARVKFARAAIARGRGALDADQLHREALQELERARAEVQRLVDQDLAEEAHG